MVRTQIMLTAAQIRALKQRAAEENLSMSELVRRSLDQVLDRGKVPTMQEIRKRAMSFKTFRGPGDLSTNHDKYFAEDIEARKKR